MKIFIAIIIVSICYFIRSILAFNSFIASTIKPIILEYSILNIPSSFSFTTSGNTDLTSCANNPVSLIPLRSLRLNVYPDNDLSLSTAFFYFFKIIFHS